MAKKQSRFEDADDDADSRGPDGTLLCPFCHKHIDVERFDRHVSKHTKLREDGQMTDHVTLPEEEREAGNLDDVPQVYEHHKCGGATGMPEEIIRSYLKNPFLYNDRTFCTGCNDYVPMKECRWTETGQKLSEYFEDLQADVVRSGKANPQKPTIAGWLIFGVIAGPIVCGGIGWVIFGLKPGGLYGALGGIVLGLLFGVKMYYDERARYASLMKKVVKLKVTYHE